MSGQFRTLAMFYPVCSIYLISLAYNPKCVKVSLAVVPFCCYQSKVHQTQSAIAASLIPPGLDISTAKSWKSGPQRSLKIWDQQTGWRGKNPGVLARWAGPGWVRGQHDVTWRRLRFSGAGGSSWVTSEFREYVPATGSRFGASLPGFHLSFHLSWDPAFLTILEKRNEETSLGRWWNWWDCEKHLPK